MKIGLSLLGWIHLVLGSLGLAPGVLVCGAILLSDDPAHRDLINIFGEHDSWPGIRVFPPPTVSGATER